MALRKLIRSTGWSLLLALLAAVGGAPPASAQTWQLVDGLARDVGIGADGSVWVIGTNHVNGGFGVYRRDGSVWSAIPGAGAVRIAVDPKGNAWVVTSGQAIFRFDGAKFVQVPGSATDIGVGANGAVWVIGAGAEAGGYGIWRTTDNGAHWVKVPGGATRISVDPVGNAWVVNNAAAIFRFDGTKFVQVPGAAQDIGVGADGAVWITGTGSQIYKWNGSSWVQKSGSAGQIAAGPAGVVWVVNASSQVYQGQDSTAVSTAVRTIFPRGQGYEVKILQALGFQRWAKQIVMGGQPPPALTPLEQGFAALALLAAEAYFVDQPTITADHAIGELSPFGGDPKARAAVSAGAGLLLEAKMFDPSRDAQTVALRAWATDLYIGIKIKTAKALLDEYNLWAQNPCKYEGLPAIRCTGASGQLSPPRPPTDLLGKNAMGSVLGTNADAITAGTAVGLAAITLGAAGGALTASLGVVVGSATYLSVTGEMVTLQVATSLFSAFGGTAASYVTTSAAAAAASLSSVSWAGVVAAPVAAAVLVVVVGTVEGIAVVEAARVQPMIKASLGAAMTAALNPQSIIIENALSDSSDAQMFFLGYQNAATQNYYSPPHSIDGEVRFYCQAGFTSRFTLGYAVPGKVQTFSFTTAALNAGSEQSFPIPANATSISVKGEWWNGSSWQSLMNASLAGPTYTGFTSYGTIFAPMVKNEYPEISGIIGKPNQLTVTQGGAYVAWIRVTYQQGSNTVTAVDDSNAAAGWHRVFSIPADATNIHLQIWDYAVTINPWVSVIDKTYPLPPNECIKVYGTTLSPQYDNECS